MASASPTLHPAPPRRPPSSPAPSSATGAPASALAKTHRPPFVAVAGVTAYRVAFARPCATIGPQQESLGPARLWILPNPSGLNASYQIDRLARENPQDGTG